MNTAMRNIRGSAQLRLPTTMTRTQNILQRRWNSTKPGAPTQKVVSPHIGFYKTFTRPIAKVLLMATFTYQLVYWGWVKLETDEVRRGKNSEVKVLEEQLEKLTKKDEKTAP